MADHVASVKQAGVKPSPKTGGILRYFGEAISELKKVVWPTRDELVRYTSVVLVFVLAVMTFVTVLDLGIGKVVFWMFGG